ncbi:hypothetical protein BV25DRAFT_1927987 [Artomyces pyxidatus]|uniref:Uncharacterized protein n=1 Tax=Artomyces pyxidatus TaxID=48021 RepID=A0ACB8T9J9_9AGAM|nr:hypothetical protein BV25DRAFT_1927987 [Artomyces pyxidatus]
MACRLTWQSRASVLVQCNCHVTVTALDSFRVVFTVLSPFVGRNTLEGSTSKLKAAASSSIVGRSISLLARTSVRRCFCALSFLPDPCTPRARRRRLSSSRAQCIRDERVGGYPNHYSGCVLCALHHPVTHCLPDFEEDDFHSTPTPFGRAPGFGFGGFNAGQESPTATTPLALPDRGDRSYFHARGDSITSDDSSHSTRPPTRKASTPFAHSSHSSIATTNSSPFSKKSSFASIRNAFKSGSKTNDPPPLPTLDHSSYPVLKNPFNRSTSSLAYVPPSSRRAPDNQSPPHPRPPTPGSNESRFTRSTPARSKGHAAARSQHSHSGSIFHNSDTGSDHGLAFGQYGSSSSPPPVPPMPNGFFGGFPQSESPTLPELEEDKVEVDPRTPAEYALHAVFIRFATTAELMIDTFLRQTLDHEPPLADYMGPGIDPKFDDILQTLGRIGQKNAKPVVDSIRRWRRTQNEVVSPDVMRLHLAQSPVSSRRTHDVPLLLHERKSLAAIYIMCRALIVVTQTLSKDALGEAMGYSLEETTFDQFRKPDLKLLSQSANHRTNAELYATLLGHLANTRFMSVTDRFLAELGPVASGQVAKDVDLKYENLIRGLKHIQIKVWPPESFEEGAEFMESLAKAFDNAHGFRFKLSFAETLVHLLHPIAKTAQAEVNHPQWAKAIEIIHPKARDLAGKPRYWHVAYALVVVSLCVAPNDYFLRNWTACFETGLNKLKEKTFRIPVMNGMMRLIWTYMFRCRESLSASTSRMETILRHFFPANRLSIFPQEDHLEPFIYIVHFLFSRHFDFGAEFCLNLMQEQAMMAQPQNIIGVLSPERFAIAIRATLLTLHLMERDEPIPVWPSSSDFSGAPSWQDYPSSSDFIPQSLLAKPGMQEFFDRCGSVLGLVAVASSNAVGHMSVFDEQWSVSRLNPSYEETHSYVIRRHPDGAFAYANNLLPQISLLQTCFQSWPRCLQGHLPVEKAVDMLIRGVIHIEPAISEAAVLALRRFMANPQHASSVLKMYAAYLFDPSHIAQEGSSTKLVIENARLLNLWVSLLDGWIHGYLEKKMEAVQDEEVALVVARLDEMEAGSLFLLCHPSRPVYTVGVKLLRMFGLITAHLKHRTQSSGKISIDRRVVEVLQDKTLVKTFCEGFEHILEPSELDRLNLWRNTTKDDPILRIADSDDPRDRTIWQWIFPTVMSSVTSDGLDRSPTALTVLRDTLIAASSRFHHTMVVMAGLSARMPTLPPARAAGVTERDGPKDNKLLSTQWYMWMKILCSLASVAEKPVLVQRDHSRAPSEVNFDRERMTTSRGLIRSLTPFLNSEHSVFRDAAVFCISSLPARGYPQLLEDLGSVLHRQLFDEQRPKAGQTQAPERVRRQERFFTAVARIYYLTAQHLQDQRSNSRQAALSPVLRFVRNTQSYLTSVESRDHFKLQKLRRYFCGIVERLFDGLATLSDTDRFVPPGMHLSLYRLCEEWCQVGRQSETVKQRLVFMQVSATNAVSSPSERGEAVALFQKETKLLSKAAIGAMASLCAKAYFPSEATSGSPIDNPLAPEYLRALDPKSTLDRIHAILASMDTSIQMEGRKALRTLLTHSDRDTGLVNEALRLGFVTAKELDTSNARFFEVVADVICNVSAHGFRFEQAICLGLFNLCHNILAIRRLALNILETVHERCSGMLSMSQFEAAIGSSSSSTYLHAHRLISDVLAGEHPDEAMDVLSQFATWLPQIFDVSNCPLVLLQSLEYWSPNINLMADDKSGLSREGRTTLYHLMALTLRYADNYSEQIQVLWTRLVDAPYQSNGHAAIRFLLEQSQKVGSVAYVRCASKVVACLSHSIIGRKIFEDLCSVIEPARMLPTIDHKLAFPDADDAELWSDLDVLFSEQPRLSLGAGQFALLFLTDVALDRAWEFQAQLPTLLHAIFTHLDHRLPFVREHAQRMLFQLLRSWICGYDELPDRSSYPNRAALKSIISELEHKFETKVWKDDESDMSSEPKMRSLCAQILSVLEPLHLKLTEVWGSLALLWGTACSIRPIAFRSLQIFRALSPGSTPTDLALLLGRLSNTVAASEENIQAFSAELIQTLKSLGQCLDLDVSLLPQMFWCACAGLSTTVEAEFLQVLGFLDSVLARLDLDDENTIDVILSQRPVDWQGTSSLQSVLLVGLRSSVTSGATFKMLQHLAKATDNRLIDPTRGRVRDLYTIALPWCLRAMTDEAVDEALEDFAQDVGYLADQEGRSSISRIMASFVKGRFRTKDDFLRQSVASLREHYGVDDWTEVVTLLLGLVLNQESWLRVSALQILKVLFQQRETRSPVELLGSELLMPLLRLLETDLASRALEVLEEPMTISGGLPARQVLRMSMLMKPMVKDVESVADVFGVPEASGWCVARPDELQELCRKNVMAVFDTCQVPSRPSRIDFEPEDIERLASPDPLEEDLGGLVQNLHELSSFFQEDGSSPKVPPVASAPSQQLAARVAAILAKSTDPITDIPQTPFVDVFRVDGLAPFGREESDDDSDYSSDSDAFMYDSPSALRAIRAVNGSKFR